MRSHGSTLILSLFLFSLVACSARDEASTVNANPRGASDVKAEGEQDAGVSSSVAESVLAAIAGEWKLESLNGEAAPDGVQTPTLQIGDDGSVSGNSGVNRYMTRLDTEALEDLRLVLEPTAGTLMGGPPEAMDLEQEYLKALGQATNVVLEDGTLRLRSEDTDILIFKRIEE